MNLFSKVYEMVNTLFYDRGKNTKNFRVELYLLYNNRKKKWLLSTVSFFPETITSVAVPYGISYIPPEDTPEWVDEYIKSFQLMNGTAGYIDVMNFKRFSLKFTVNMTTEDISVVLVPEKLRKKENEQE